MFIRSRLPIACNFIGIPPLIRLSQNSTLLTRSDPLLCAYITTDNHVDLICDHHSNRWILFGITWRNYLGYCTSCLLHLSSFCVHLSLQPDDCYFSCDWSTEKDLSPSSSWYMLYWDTRRCVFIVSYIVIR